MTEPELLSLRGMNELLSLRQYLPPVKEFAQG